MRYSTTRQAAILVTGALLFGALTLSAAIPQKKKPKKTPTKPAASSNAKLIAEGHKIYLAKGCLACHIVGKEGASKTGPELTHVASKRKPAWMAAQVRDPKKFDKNSAMPAYPEGTGTTEITAKQLKALVAYMSSLK